MNEQGERDEDEMGMVLRERRHSALAVDPTPAGTSMPGGTAPDDDSLFSLEPLKRWANFVLRAVKRHWIVAFVTFVVFTMVGGILLASSPPQYQTTATILLGGDRSLGGVEGGSTTASRQAESIILRRDNLDSIIEELGLLAEPEKPFFGRLQDELLPSEQSTGERAEEVRDQLLASVIVFSNESAATVDISVLWSDPQQAAAIAEAAYDRFLDERFRLEVEPLQQQVAILTGREQRAAAEVEAIRDELDLSDQDGAAAGSVLEGANNELLALQAEVRAAEVSLAEAEAGIEFRYALSSPADIPTKPLSGNLTGYIAAVMMGLIFMGLVCVALDAPRGRVVATWQLEQERIPVLAVLSPVDRSR